MELEQRLLEAKLRQQQLQSEADSRWLHQEESNLVRISINSMASISNVWFKGIHTGCLIKIGKKYSPCFASKYDFITICTYIYLL